VIGLSKKLKNNGSKYLYLSMGPKSIATKKAKLKLGTVLLINSSKGISNKRV